MLYMCAATLAHVVHMWCTCVALAHAWPEGAQAGGDRVRQSCMASYRELAFQIPGIIIITITITGSFLGIKCLVRMPTHILPSANPVTDGCI